MFYCNMAIDSHVHTKYSKHAVGEIEDVILVAISRGVRIITITDHAPFPIDCKNRILLTELNDYLDEIYKLKYLYRDDITILTGLECDFIPREKYVCFVKYLLDSVDIDYAIGSIHYVFLDNEKYNIWDIEKINNINFIEEYFVYLRELVNSNLFDSIGHPDSILRCGMTEKLFLEYLKPLISIIHKNNIAWEINTSGSFKKSICDSNGIINTYPSLKALDELSKNKVNFTIGSDAHNPKDVFRGYSSIMSKLDEKTIDNIVYFKKRKAYNKLLGGCF